MMSPAESVERGGRTYARSNAIRDIFAELGDEFLRDEYRVPGREIRIFVCVFATQKVIQVELLDLNPVCRHSMKQEHLGLCCGHQPSGDSDALRNRRLGAQVILAGLTYLAGSQEVWLLKIHQVHVDDRVVKGARLGLLQG